MIRLALITAGSVVLAGCATASGAPVGAEPATAPATAAGSSDAPDTMRWLYGSGEAAAASIQTWRQIAQDNPMTRRRMRRAGQCHCAGASRRAVRK